MTRCAGLLALELVAALMQPAFLWAQVDCSLAGRRSPAQTVPECVNSNGFAVSCGTAGSILLWPPNGFHPASQIPLSRDSTDRIGGLTIPGRKRGHELFKTVDVVTVGNVSPRLYVSYNAGFQVWDIATNPANPVLLNSRDGWEGELLNFPPVSEVLNFIADVSALNVDPTTDLVGVAGIDPVGPSFWEFKTTTNQLRQLYQDTPTGARQVRLIKHGTTVYAFVGADNGLAVYNVTAARALSPPCLDQQGTSCPTVFRGFVGNTGSQVRSFIDTLHVPAAAGKPERIFVSAAGGLFTDLELWEVRNPQAPQDSGSTVRRFSGFRNTLGSALFSYDGHHYVAFVSEEDGFNKEKLRIFSIDGCINGSTCSLADGSMVEAINPIPLAANQPTTWDFLTYSQGPRGSPYLYYSVGSTNVSGPDLEQLFDLSTLRPPFPRPGPAEITAGGGSYTDPCNGATIRYWSHYYSRNYHGLNEMVPWGGKLSANGYFYRAAHSILDVHVLGSAPSDTKITIISADSGPRGAFESCETVPLAAKLAGRGPAWWEWRSGGQALAGCSGSFPARLLAGDVVECNVPAGRFLTGPVFSDGFERGDTSAWSTTVSPRLAAGTSVTAEVRVWKTADKSLPPEDVKQVVFTLVERGAPRFSGPPQVTVNELTATLTHPAVDASTWAWEIESPGGAATCTFPGRGQVRCVKATTTAAQQHPETFTHTWPSPGTYKVRVTLSNCGAATAVRNAEVTVAAATVVPNVVSFALRGAQAACCGNLLSGFTCSRGVEVEVAVGMQQDADYAFSFDWARASSSASPSFASQTPSGKDAAKLEWYFKHTFTNTGSVFPIVRARVGGATGDRTFINVPLQIINGSCR